ncbi:MAG: MFS transporter [Clostridia bacterium]|nr:MFS transporter [Clostridia bacterium]
MEKTRFRRAKIGCYTTNVATALVCNIVALLFVPFRELYGISYALLGLLVLINFVTQLCVDLACSFFSSKINIPKAIKATPVLLFVGLWTFALAPYIAPNHVYAGLVVGTIIFSAACGFNEALMSPMIAAIPSDNPEREMSKLHSLYAWGVIAVVAVSTLFLWGFGRENWQFLVMIMSVIPFVSGVLFLWAEIPQMAKPEKVSGAFSMLKNKTLWLCFAAIFFGGASETIMSQWSSSYLEQALGISKVYGDIFGVAVFALFLGLGRTLYAKMGKNIEKVLFFGCLGAVACYAVAILSPVPVLGLVACALTGFCTSMLWPGSLIVASDRMPNGGVFVFSMMAAGGDCGASVSSQLIGVVVDQAERSSYVFGLAQDWGLTIEELSMKVGLSVGALFPIIGVLMFAIVLKTKKKPKTLPLKEN